MYSLRPYLDETSCIANKSVLVELVQNAAINKLWLSTDHIFISTITNRNTCLHDLYVFDVIPQLTWRRSNTTTAKQQDYTICTNQELTIEVVWFKSEPSLVYVVSESGTTTIWEFLRPTHEWTQRKCFQLNNAKGAKIVDVKLHEETGTIVWCEKRGSGGGYGAYCVCCRGINVNIKSETWNIELGSIQAILHNCPPVALFSFRDGVCVRPCQEHLEKFCIFWSGVKNMKAVVFKNASVEESRTCPSDFRDIATALIGYWGTNLDDSSLSILATTVHPSNDDILIMNYLGMINKVQIKSNQIKSVAVCKIQLPQSVLENTKKVKVFADGLTFGLIDQYGGIFLFDIVSGKLLCNITEVDGTSEKYNVTYTHSVVSSTVFWTAKSLLKLKSPTPSQLINTTQGSEPAERQEDQADPDVGEITKNVVNEDVLTTPEDLVAKGIPREDIQTKIPSTSGVEGPKELHKDIGLLDIAVWLSLYGLDHSAAMLILDHIVAQMEKRMGLPRNAVEFLRKLSDKVFQNPAILLALHKNDLSLDDESLASLQQFLEEFDQGLVPSSYITPLNVQIEPFLRELFNVMSRLREVTSSDLTKLESILSDGTETDLDRTLTSVLSGTSDANLLDKMEILCLHEPERVVQELLPECGQVFNVETQGTPSKVCQILRNDLKDKRWKHRRNPDNALVLRAFFKLLYKNHPEVLLDVLQVAKSCINQGASKDEAIIQDLEECLRDFMLEFLPSVWSEDGDTKRIKVHSDLLVRLGLQHDAMGILIQRQQWHLALDLYIELSQPSADQQLAVQLYVILLAGMLREYGTSEKPLLIKLLELKPDVIAMHDLFQLFMGNIAKKDTVAIFDGEGLTVEEARRALGQFLTKM